MTTIDSATSGSLFGDHRKFPESPPTVQLLADAKAGDKSAVNQLMDRHRDSLERIVRLRLDKKIQNRVGVSDVVQDVLLEVNRRLPKYLDSPAMPFRLWIRQIAQDRMIDAYRRHRGSAKRSVDREQAMSIPRGQDQSSMQLASLLGDSKIGPAEAMIQKEMVRKVENAIGQLDERDTEIIVMRHYKHLTNQEASLLLNLSQAATSMRYLRAIRRLKDLMQNPEQAT